MIAFGVFSNSQKCLVEKFGNKFIVYMLVLDVVRNILLKEKRLDNFVGRSKT